ncbi:MAG: ATP synthase F1 subunit epsilon [Alphaproteobacteria bacterium]|nr:ATP synthase F1 subunit epsilon [Alphaproteobacteria bacterium]
MAQSIQFDLSSPQKLHYSKAVAMVSVPGSDGVFGVLPGHAPMGSTVAMGVVDIYESDVNVITERLFVVGGFCEVTTTYCTVMADQVIPVKSLKRELIEDELAQLNAGASNDETAFKLCIAQAKLLALTA